jgi:hypothetical protein
MPDWIVAREIWQAAKQFRAASGLRVAERVHDLLVERFAFGEAPYNQYAQLPLHGNLAAWRLIEAEDILSISLFGHLGSLAGKVAEKDDGRALFEHFASRPVNYQGLQEPLVSSLKTIVQATRQLAAGVAKGSGDRAASIAEYIVSIGQLLDEPGIPGWLAARYLKTVFASSRSKVAMAVVQQRISDPDARAVIRRAREFYGSTLRVLQRPRVVRIEAGAPLVPISRVIASILQGNDASNVNWLRHTPLSPDDVPSVIEACGDIDAALLVKLAAFDFRISPRRTPLKTANLQKILAIARRSNEEDVIAGSIIAVAGSKFLRLSGNDLLLKMLANKRQGRHLAQLIFRGLLPGHGPEQLSILQALAKGVMGNPKNYEMYTVLAAANFWAEHSRSKLLPLATSIPQLRKRMDIG